MLVSLSWPFHTNYWYHIKYFISFNNSLTETIKIKIILCLQQAAYITSQLSSPSWSTNVTHKKAHFFTTNIGEFSEVRSMDHQKKKDKTERASGLGRRTRDRKGESNDSPEILDKGRTHQASLWRGFFNFLPMIAHNYVSGTSSFLVTGACRFKWSLSRYAHICVDKFPAAYRWWTNSRVETTCVILSSS